MSLIRRFLVSWRKRHAAEATKTHASPETAGAAKEAETPAATQTYQTTEEIGRHTRMSAESISLPARRPSLRERIRVMYPTSIIKPVVFTLGAVAVIGQVGTLFLAWAGKPTPDSIISTTGNAITALGMIFTQQYTMTMMKRNGNTGTRDTEALLSGEAIVRDGR